MGRLGVRVLWLDMVLLVSVVAGCGGGSTVTPPPPPPVPDFSLNLSANSISVSEGGTNAAVNVSVNPSNGFTGNVQVTLSGLPAGVRSNPASPFDVAAGATTSVVFGAAPTAAAGNFTVSAQGNSGTLSHSQTLTLTVQAGVVSMLSRTGYVRTDSGAAADVSFGEPHHRHIAYDPANKQVFVANRAINRVEVFSASSQARIAQISVPGPQVRIFLPMAQRFGLAPHGMSSLQLTPSRLPSRSAIPWQDSPQFQTLFLTAPLRFCHSRTARP